MFSTLKRRFVKWLRARKAYKTIRLSDADIRSGKYKSLLGGGPDEWQTRGEFQVVLLKAIGMERRHRLLDVGCGPLRAGEHFIRALDAGGYCGIDYNPDFIEVARQIVAGHADLAAKSPRLEPIEGFDVARLDARFDYVMVFSVLNHCTFDEKKQFFVNIRSALNPGARILITHSKWFDESFLEGSGLKLAARIKSPGDIFPPSFNLDDWGWRNGEANYLFPILELAPAGMA